MTSIQALRDDQHDDDSELLVAFDALREAQAGVLAAEQQFADAEQQRLDAGNVAFDALQRFRIVCKHRGVIL